MRISKNVFFQILDFSRLFSRKNSCFFGHFWPIFEICRYWVRLEWTSKAQLFQNFLKKSKNPKKWHFLVFLRSRGVLEGHWKTTIFTSLVNYGICIKHQYVHNCTCTVHSPKLSKKHVFHCFSKNWPFLIDFWTHFWAFFGRFLIDFDTFELFFNGFWPYSTGLRESKNDIFWHILTTKLIFYAPVVNFRKKTEKFHFWQKSHKKSFSSFSHHSHGAVFSR